jgi:ubiquinone/menaquinone biosynthesis C-methylase UbiE
VLGHAAHWGGDPDVVLVHAEAAHLPVADASVDVAHASLLLHHLDPAAALACLAEMCRVARYGVVVNDVRRGIGAFLTGAPVVLAMGRSQMTRHDGLASLRRAYTVAELDGMLEQVGLNVRSRSNTLLPRVVTAAIPRPSL